MIDQAISDERARELVEKGKAKFVAWGRDNYGFLLIDNRYYIRERGNGSYRPLRPTERMYEV